MADSALIGFLNGHYPTATDYRALWQWAGGTPNDLEWPFHGSWEAAVTSLGDESTVTPLSLARQGLFDYPGTHGLLRLLRQWAKDDGAQLAGPVEWIAYVTHEWHQLGNAFGGLLAGLPTATIDSLYQALAPTLNGCYSESLATELEDTAATWADGTEPLCPPRALVDGMSASVDLLPAWAGEPTGADYEEAAAEVKTLLDRVARAFPSEPPTSEGHGTSLGESERQEAQASVEPPVEGRDLAGEPEAPDPAEIPPPTEAMKRASGHLADLDAAIDRLEATVGDRSRLSKGVTYLRLQLDVVRSTLAGEDDLRRPSIGAAFQQTLWSTLPGDHLTQPPTSLGTDEEPS